MLKANEIKDAVGSILRDAYPGENVYTKLLPKDFKRPSHYVEMGGKTGTPGNMSLTEVDVTVRVTAFPPVDDYGDADDEAVDQAGDELLELFVGQVLRAADRSLAISKTEIEYGADFAAAVLTYRYVDDTPRPDPPKRQMMEHLTVNKDKIV